MWSKVAEDGYTRWVADYDGYMLDVWRYAGEQERATVYWRVTHPSLPLPIIGVESTFARSKLAATREADREKSRANRYP